MNIKCSKKLHKYFWDKCFYFNSCTLLGLKIYKFKQYTKILNNQIFLNM